MSKISNKAAQYTAELSSARLRGTWSNESSFSAPTSGRDITNAAPNASSSSEKPAATPATTDAAAAGANAANPTGGAGTGPKVDWPELLRKFRKHNPDKGTTLTIATQEHTLRSNLAAYYAEVGYGDASHLADTASPSQGGKTVFPPIVQPDQNGIGWSGKAVNEVLSSLAILSKAGISNISDKRAVTSIRALATFALGQDEAAVSLLHDTKFLEDAHDESVEGLDYNIALSLQGFVVYGMVNERLHDAQPEAGYAPFALAGYARAISLHELVRGGKRANALRGIQADEIERWGEVALYRNAMLSVREGDLTTGINALRAYQAHAGRWPADFRLPQRNIISRTYLVVLNRTMQTGTYTPPPALPPKSTDDWRSRAFQDSVVTTVASRVALRDFQSELSHRDNATRRPLSAIGVHAKGVTSRTVSRRRPNPHLILRPSSATWSNELLTTQLAAAASIQNYTEFPHAGKVNVPVVELANTLVEGWSLNGQQGGRHADEIIKVLYKLTHFTFQSQCITRHLITLLTAAEAYKEAGRALTLYQQIVDKARETDQAASAVQLLKNAKLAEADKKALTNGNHAVVESDAEQQESAKKILQDQLKDSDGDDVYVPTLLFGARMLVKYLDNSLEADKLGRKALNILEEDKNKDLIAKDGTLVPLAMRIAGVARYSLAIQSADPVKRPILQKEALELLTTSAKLDDQSSETWYHLAYLQASLREVKAGIASARKAVELEPADVQSWHLLTLLLSGQKDYKAALRVAEVALSQAEEDDEADERAGAASAAAAKSSTKTNGVAVNGNGAHALAEVQSQLLSVDFPPTSAERAETIFRLMQTHNVLEEIVEGVDAAIDGQREIFAFYLKRISTGAVPIRSAVPAGQTGTVTSTAPGPARGNSVRRTNSINTNASSVQRSQGRLSTFLHGGSKTNVDNAGSLSGMGQSGATLTRFTSATSSILSRAHTDADGYQVPSASLSASAARVQPLDEEQSAELEAVRAANTVRHESALLTSLWLLAAASFRRSRRSSDCRAAIQEAEQLAPGNADVWVQLALWFVESDDVSLAINALYKGLACDISHTAAAVHLARLFLSHPTLRPSTSHDAAGTSSYVSVNDDATRSRNLGAGPGHREHKKGARSAAAAAVADSKLPAVAPITSPSEPAERRDKTAVDLAEGLMDATTTAYGWDVPEAWLYLGQVHSRTDRKERAHECFKYALLLEQTKPVRPIGRALPRCS